MAATSLPILKSSAAALLFRSSIFGRVGSQPSLSLFSSRFSTFNNSTVTTTTATITTTTATGLTCSSSGVSRRCAAAPIRFFSSSSAASSPSATGSAPPTAVRPTPPSAAASEASFAGTGGRGKAEIARRKLSATAYNPIVMGAAVNPEPGKPSNGLPTILALTVAMVVIPCAISVSNMNAYYRATEHLYRDGWSVFHYDEGKNTRLS